MQVSKIHLSHAEIELIQNAEIILTKNRVLEKVKILLVNVQNQQVDFIENHPVTDEIFKVSAKISKGENYLGLPYLILDYPRQSSEKNFFFIRTMFWWGNFFSCTLHLANESKKMFKEKIVLSYSVLTDYYINTTDDPWAHHLMASDYRKINSMTKQEFEKVCEEFSHLKIAVRHPITEILKKPFELFENWKNFITVCGLVT